MSADASRTLSFELRSFDNVTINATDDCWRRDLAKHRSELMPAVHEGRLEWARAHMDYAQDDGKSLAYGIFKDGQPHAAAIVDIVYTRSGRKWLKMLDLTLCPSLDLAFFPKGPQQDHLREIFDVFSAAIVGTIRLTKANHPTKVTKLYGRGPTLLAFLSGIGAQMAANASTYNLDFEVSVEGRWLVFRQK